MTNTKNSSAVDPGRILNINVGVLGHVDSGKTSLVKTLSTLLSTAALDKSSQSRQRGITLDLGFSAFLIHELPPQLEEYSSTDYDCLQVTLVDCPGHASLIRTIIGGAQIIDMVLLVIDANKGIQTQTAECLVIAEMTTRNLIVALNKVDLFPEQEREEKLALVQKRIRLALKSTRFRDAPMVGVAAAVGGEKVAAAMAQENKKGNALPKDNHNKHNETAAVIPSTNIDGLLELIKSQITLPNRKNKSGNFYFSIDHCFPIKGQGTVITGTVLSGSAKVNDMVSFPEIGSLERKVKSIQMFRRQVPAVHQGDRCGICMANLDSKLIERGVAATPGSVSLIDSAICIAKKVKFFKGKLHSESKFHVSVGHTTVMATVTFFGARELAARLAKEGTVSSSEPEQEKNEKEDVNLGYSSLGGSSICGLPIVAFDYDEDFIHQDEMLDHLPSSEKDEVDDLDTTTKKASSTTEAPLHWAILQFQTPVYCPLNSLVIGSRLDTDIQANSCRLAFSGRLIQKFDPLHDNPNLKIYTFKEKAGVVCRLGDSYTRATDQAVVRYEIYGNDLFKKETSMNQFVGLKIETEAGEIGVIQSSFGTTGKFKCNFPAGTCVKEGDALTLRFKRYANDKKKAMHQNHIILPNATTGTKMDPVVKKSKKKSKDKKKKQASQVAESAALTKNDSNLSTESTTNNASSKQYIVIGEIASLKGDLLENNKHPMAIISNLFTPEENIRQKIGFKVIVTDSKEEGTIAGPFGKAGKCKVNFELGVSSKEGTKVHLIVPN